MILAGVLGKAEVMATASAFSSVSTASEGEAPFFDAVILTALQAARRGANLCKVVVMAGGLFSAVS